MSKILDIKPKKENKEIINPLKKDISDIEKEIDKIKDFEDVKKVFRMVTKK